MVTAASRQRLLSGDRLRALALTWLAAACSTPGPSPAPTPAPQSTVPQQSGYLTFLPHSEACTAAKQLHQLYCTGCGPELCGLAQSGCFSATYCAQGEEALELGIDPCRYIAIGYLVDHPDCQAFGRDLGLPEGAVPRSKWQPEARSETLP